MEAFLIKSSIYNLYIPLDNGEFTLFNTLTNSLLLVDYELKNSLENNHFQEIETKKLDTLKSLGVIVDDDINERDIYLIKYHKMIHSVQELRFVIVTTYECNLMCPYCYQGNRTSENKSFNEDMANKSIDAIKGLVLSEGVKELKIMLFGGEPLLNSEIGLKILKDLSIWSKSQGISFEGAISTNGTLITPETIKVFSPYLSLAQLTLDGPKWYHDKKRAFKNGSGTYDKVMGSLKLLRAAGISVALRIQVSPENLDYLDQLFDDIKSENILDDPGVKVYTSQLKNRDQFCSNSCDCSSCDKEDLLPTTWKYDINQKPIASILPCPIYSGLHILDPYGDIYKCILSLRQNNFIMGTFQNGAFDFSYNFYDFMTRNPLDIESCFNCIYLPMCGGGCPYMAMIKGGSYQSNYCGFAKDRITKKIRYYIEHKYPEKINNISRS